ncbi:MAG: UDP-N-acetylmuramate dehydrogenase [Deltaproteobacteria bacterium]|jgi:UDP-N-acetylmuramate dehydrogenase
MRASASFVSKQGGEDILKATPVASSGPGSIRDELVYLWQGPVAWECPLARYTTPRVGGPAAALIEPSTLSELTSLLKGLRSKGLPWRVIGRGSNVLVADEGLPEVVIVLGPSLAAIGHVEQEGEERLVQAEAGCSLPRLVSWCTAAGLSGLEFAVGIPGSVGGAIVMNAGAWGREICEALHALVVVDEAGEARTLPATAETFEYRRWEHEEGVIVAAGIFKLQTGSPEAIEKRCRAHLQARRERQPLGLPSAGSFFKNPPEMAAGRLIEEAGLKGLQVGGAMVSERHANFLVNVGGATARDFYQLMCIVQERVEDRTGIRLEPEVHLLGFQEGR